jgi:DNA repair photolyase
MKWQKTEIVNDLGETVSAQAPVLVSASRSTDIPTFYADWFVGRWKQGYVKWKNPFNNTYSYVSFKNTRIVVFWTKNPRPIMKHLDFLDEEIKNYYFQFTLNDYDNEGLEGKVPKLESRINTFIELSERIGKERVIWRFDPMILTNNIGVQDLLKRVKYIGDRLKDHTRKLVFSYADISIYRKVENNLKREGVEYIEFDKEKMHELAAGLQELNKSWNFEIATCAEKIPLEQYGIKHNKCVDDDLMVELFGDDKELMEFLGIKIEEPTLFDDNSHVIKTRALKDTGQREACGCIVSKDIGQYNTCPHGCVYCYANTSPERASQNYKEHRENPTGDIITGI